MTTNRANSVLVTGIYTLTPLHCGTGQTTGAVDLPISREKHTDIPIIPSSGLKGVARDRFGGICQEPEKTSRMFGPSTEDAGHAAGALIFTEGRLLALPVRSLNRAFLYITCPLIVERLQRDLEAFGASELFPDDWVMPELKAGQSQVADQALADSPLVLEDLVWKGSEVGHSANVAELAEMFCSLLPDKPARDGQQQIPSPTQNRLARDLVMIPDEDFCHLTRRSPPVEARIRLNEDKTTGKSNSGKEENNRNLWYEETLPSDALFISFVLPREQRIVSGNGQRDKQAVSESPIHLLEEFYTTFSSKPCVVQIGGNETVGQGWCWWTLRNCTEAGLEEP